MFNFSFPIETKNLKPHELAALIVVLVFVIYYRTSHQEDKKSYAPQEISNSSNVIQIQGDNNMVNQNKQNQKPTLQYHFEGLSNRNELREDGLYHSDIKVSVSFPEKDSLIEISPKLQCREDNVWNFPVFNTESGITGLEVVKLYHCASTEPIKENAGYFLYKVGEK